MNQNAAGTLNQYPNLIELIGRQSELLGTPMWEEPAIGSDGSTIESGLNPLSASHDNILQDAVRAIGQDGETLDHDAIGQDGSGREAIGQDGEPLGHDAIGQDGEPEILGHEVIGQDGDDIAQVGATLAS